MRIFWLLFVILIFLFFFDVKMGFTRVGAISEIDQLQKEIDELAHLKSLSEAATAPLEAEVKNLEARVASARASITRARQQVTELSNSIVERESALLHHYKIFANRIAKTYKRERTLSPIVSLFSSDSASQLTKSLAYQDSARNQDDRLIRSLSTEISQLNQDKKQLESDQLRLASLEKQLNEQAEFFKGEIAKAKSYQKELGGKIADLSSKQQAIIAARSGSYITGVGAVPISGDFDSTIAGFKANAPSGSFAVFTFGAFTHRNGMSQYGAKARADGGQDYKTILKAYYGKEPVSKDTGGDIKVSGLGGISFEDKYLYGIAEMPSSWPKEALKAQAVAARTYAYRYKNDDKEICITEKCQVYNSSKAENVPQAWKEAVQETRGMVLEDVSTQYSAITGGYLNTSGWDTTDGKGGNGDWTTNSWEVKANAPWFYKAWYRQTLPGNYSDNNNPCGRKPWLTQEEMSDILNAYLLRQNLNGADSGRIVPTTINQCPVGEQSGNPYSMSELRSYVSNPVTSISSLSVQNNSNGQTTSVSFQTNRGDISMSGSQFKEVFNLRAPGYLAIHQNGFSFFNIEKK